MYIARYIMLSVVAGALFFAPSEVFADPMLKGLLGQWERCAGDIMHFEKTGEFRYERRQARCELGGKVQVRDGRLSFDIQRNTCGREIPSWMAKPNKILLGSDSVVLTSGGMGSLGRHFTRAKLKRETWSLRDDEGHAGEVLLCFFEDGSFMDGHYKSSTGDCNFMGTCQGKIDDVQVKEGSTQIWMRCWGECPCNGVIVSTNSGSKPGSAKTVMGHYRSTNCQTTFERTFTGRVVLVPAASFRKP